MSDVFRILMMF